MSDDEIVIMNGVGALIAHIQVEIFAQTEVVVVGVDVLKPSIDELVQTIKTINTI